MPHVSAYLLKIEPRTAFYQRREQLQLPDEDETCSLYEAACEELERHGLMQYEISNFARPGFESRHNLKYWHCEEYLGLGPAAHSFLNGKRFYEARDLRAFLAGKRRRRTPTGDARRWAGGICDVGTPVGRGLTGGALPGPLWRAHSGAMETCGAAVCPRWA